MAPVAVVTEQAEFCDSFFPASSNPSDLAKRPKLKKNLFARLLKADELTEAVVRDRFTEAVNDNNLTPGLRLCGCGERPDPRARDQEEQKVDMAFYRAEHTIAVGEQCWSDQIIPVEFMPTQPALHSLDDSDGTDNKGASIPQKEVPVDTARFELLYAIQHRVALFTVIIIGATACFVRWDRSGSVITQALKYVENWEFFCDILWRISLCSDTQLGLDPTATRLRPGDPDFDRMAVAAEPHETDVDEVERDIVPGDLPTDRGFVYKYVRTMFSDSVASHWSRYRVEVPDAGGVRKFLIAKPTFWAKGFMVGRGTRGYVALDCKTGDFVWLKDTWRAHYLLLNKEGDMVRRLNEAKVMNVPTLICHGDIEDQVTSTPTWWEAKNPPSSSEPESNSNSSSPSSSSLTLHTHSTSSPASHKRKRDDESPDLMVSRNSDCKVSLSASREDCPLRRYKHYRLVEKEVCMPLHLFTDGLQLASLVLDCIYAHYEACTKPGIPMLHGDISGGNILIIPRIVSDDTGSEIKWTGLLTDWEMAKPRDCQTQVLQDERIGTWQFQSVALLCAPKKVEICDELEAFFYVLLYYGARYLHSNIHDTAVGYWISEFFDSYIIQGDTYICGNRKLGTIRTGSFTVAASITHSTSLDFGSPMDFLLKNLLRWFNANHVVTCYLDAHEKSLQAPPDQHPDSETSNSKPPRKRRRVLRLPFRSDSVSKSDSEDSTAGKPSWCRGIAQPSEEDWKFYKQVLEHGPMMDLFERAVDTGHGWNRPWTADKVGDRAARLD